jgi:hypothetical protein
VPDLVEEVCTGIVLDLKIEIIFTFFQSHGYISILICIEMLLIFFTGKTYSLDDVMTNLNAGVLISLMR